MEAFTQKGQNTQTGPHTGVLPAWGCQGIPNEGLSPMPLRENHPKLGTLDPVGRREPYSMCARITAIK